MVKLSIVIPVYNVMNSLAHCIDSVLSQDFADWHMVLVDDASPDGCGQTCEEYARKDKRITVVHHETNRGLSAARNTGIALCEGEYITFIDSDDHIAPTTLQTLMSELECHPEYDILEYPVCERFNSKQQHKLMFGKHVYHDMYAYWLQGKAYLHTYAWNKIYRRKLFADVAFPDGKNFEDVWTLPLLLRRCDVVATTDAGLYYYTDNPHGITRQASLQDLVNHLQAHIEVIKWLHPTPVKKNFPKSLTNDFAQYYATVANIMLDVGDRTSDNQEQIAFPILPYWHTIKLKLLHLLGQKHLCKIHRLLRHGRL